MSQKSYYTRYYGVDKAVGLAFQESLERHIAYVREAGQFLGVEKCQLKLHDDSKWGALEFPGYANHLHGGGAPDEFARAWLHHVHHNPHHWQHWIFPDGYTPEGSQVENGIIEMPANFALEMVADWMGSEKAKRDSWDMTDWLMKHIPKIRVHSKTAAYLRYLLDQYGYADIIWSVRFAHEIELELDTNPCT